MTRSKSSYVNSYSSLTRSAVLSSGEAAFSLLPNSPRLSCQLPARQGRLCHHLGRGHAHRDQGRRRRRRPSFNYIYIRSTSQCCSTSTRHHLRPFHRGRAHARNRHAIAHAYVSPSLATAHALLEPQYSILPKECAHASFEPFRVSCTCSLI